jgi:hypothetical protein
MNKDEALRLALEALQSGDYWKGVEAVNAIKQALEQPEALRLADALSTKFFNFTELDEQAADCLRRLHEVNQELLEALQLLVGSQDDPNNGWRGSQGTENLFDCEYCHAKHLDCTKIEHSDLCPIPQARAAIAKATGESK